MSVGYVTNERYNYRGNEVTGLPQVSCVFAMAWAGSMVHCNILAVYPLGWVIQLFPLPKPIKDLRVEV